MTAISRKGPWHLARTLAAQTGMTNKWLSEQGLISVKEQWVKIHYPDSPVILVKRPVRIPMQGVVGAGGFKNPPATRLERRYRVVVSFLD